MCGRRLTGVRMEITDDTECCPQLSMMMAVRAWRRDAHGRTGRGEIVLCCELLYFELRHLEIRVVETGGLFRIVK